MPYLQQTLKPSFIYRLNILVVSISNENVKGGSFYYFNITNPYIVGKVSQKRKYA